MSIQISDTDLPKSFLSFTNISPTTSVVSAAEVEVEFDGVTTLLNSISSHFSVKPTKYGGRGCFANIDLAQGTIVYECSVPLSSTSARPFKKEVCGSCFKFLHRKTLKFKLIASTSSLALYFCSQPCMDKFIALDIDGLYLESLLNVESLFIKGLNQCQHDHEKEKQQEEVETETALRLENELK
jgi:hypothetical protein